MGRLCDTGCKLATRTLESNSKWTRVIKSLPQTSCAANPHNTVSAVHEKVNAVLKKNCSYANWSWNTRKPNFFWSPWGNNEPIDIKLSFRPISMTILQSRLHEPVLMNRLHISQNIFCKHFHIRHFARHFMQSGTYEKNCPRDGIFDVNLLVAKHTLLPHCKSFATSMNFVMWPRQRQRDKLKHLEYQTPRNMHRSLDFFLKFDYMHTACNQKRNTKSKPVRKCEFHSLQTQRSVLLTFDGGACCLCSELT